MLAMPDKMVTLHWDMPSTAGMEFWIRGHAVTMGALSYALFQLPTEVAVKIALAVAVGIGIIYPLNAKIGIFSNPFPVKYPMHYMPELLMLGLSIAGALAL